MKLYRVGVIIIVVLMASGFLFLEHRLLPTQLSRYVTNPFRKLTQDPSFSSLLAPPPEVDEYDRHRGAIPIKRSFEDTSLGITPPLLDGLVNSSRLESLDILQNQPREDLFPIPPSIRTAVNFWKSIYADYSRDQVVIHDDLYLDQIYDVLDFADLKNQDYSDLELAQLKREIELDRLAEIDKALAHLDDIEGTAQFLSPMEGKIWKMWSFMNDNPNRFREARKRLRTQTGVQEAFERAIIRSGTYLTYMEDIFLSYNLPIELTRLVFVESMFVNAALSKTGAAGLWQFMPGTAKRYMKINKWVDERLDPFIASHAAAQLLRNNYDVLGSWPLAINAYNSGAGRLKRAIRQLGTDDIGIIIRDYHGYGYGFASRNFYPEFIAALEVAENHRQIFGDIPISNPITYEVISLPSRARFEDLADILELDLASLQDLNPAFQDSAFNTDVYLPKGASIRVPLGEGDRVITSVYNIERPSGPTSRP